MENSTFLVLASSEILDTLKTPPRKKTTQKSGDVRRCYCGRCPRCLDNAKWEHRFNELYGAEMEEYYARPFTRRRSMWGDL